MIGWWFGPSYLLGQVNFGIDAAAILGILLAAGGGGFFALRSLRPELSREQDIVIASISLLCGLILIFKGWELNQIHEFNQFLLTGIAVFLAYDNIRMRAATVEQAKRRTPTVDRKRRTSRVYRAELDEIEPYYEGDKYYDDMPRPERRRLKGTAVARPSRDADYEREYVDDYGDRDRDRRSRGDRDTEYSDDRRSEGSYDRRRDAWDDESDIDYDDTRGYDRYARDERETEGYDREESYRDERSRGARRSPEGGRGDWQDERDDLRARPAADLEDRGWRDDDRPLREDPRRSYGKRGMESERDDRRARGDRQDDRWDEPADEPRTRRAPDTTSDVRDWRDPETPEREARPPIPNVARRRPRSAPEDASPRPSSSSTADYADYEPLDDDYELGDSEY